MRQHLSTYINGSSLVAIDYSDDTPDVAFAYDRLRRQKVAQTFLSAYHYVYAPATLALGKCRTALLTSIAVWYEYFQYTLEASDFRRNCTDYPPQMSGQKQPCTMASFLESAASAKYVSAIKADLTTRVRHVLGS